MSRTRSVQLGSCVAIALLVAVHHAQAQGRCPENREMDGTVGIQRLECVGRSCTVGERGEGGIYFHSFAVEPRIGALNRSVQPARLLQVGDVILAIDDVPITTSEGGRRLANLDVGEAIRLRIRRQENEIELELIPVLGCNTPSLSVRIP